MQDTDADIDYELIEHTANILLLYVFDLLLENFADDNEKSKALRQASEDAFRLFLILPRRDTGISDGMFVLRTCVLAILGDMSDTAVRWLGKIDWPNLPLESSDWRERTWATVLDAWLRLVRKDEGSDLDAVLQNIDHLRKSQMKYEALYLENSEPKYASGAALELIGLYHLTRAAEILATYITDGNVDGDYQIHQLLDTQFDRVMSVCEYARLIELEAMCRLLSVCAHQMTENSI